MLSMSSEPHSAAGPPLPVDQQLRRLQQPQVLYPDMLLRVAGVRGGPSVSNGGRRFNDAGSAACRGDVIFHARTRRWKGFEGVLGDRRDQHVDVDTRTHTHICTQTQPGRRSWMHGAFQDIVQEAFSSFRGVRSEGPCQTVGLPASARVRAADSGDRRPLPPPAANLQSRTSLNNIRCRRW